MNTKSAGDASRRKRNMAARLRDERVRFVQNSIKTANCKRSSACRAAKRASRLSRVRVLLPYGCQATHRDTRAFRRAPRCAMSTHRSRRTHTASSRARSLLRCVPLLCALQPPLYSLCGTTRRKQPEAIAAPVQFT